MRKQEKGSDYRLAILKAIAVSAGLISIAVLAPNALQILNLFNDKKRRRWRSSYIRNNVLKKMQKEGLIEISAGQVAITSKGEDILKEYEIKRTKIKKPKNWDGKFRIIIFDIKEKRRSVRDELRTWLEDLGFVRLQNSVWAHPYECEEVISLIKANYDLGKDVVYITADYIENNHTLKRKFNLN